MIDALAAPDLPPPVDALVNTVLIRPPAKGRFYPVVAGLGVYLHAVHPCRPEGVPFGINQPPAPAVVVGAEKTRRLELLSLPAAIAGEAIRQSMGRGAFELFLQPRSDLFGRDALPRPLVQRVWPRLTERGPLRKDRSRDPRPRAGPRREMRQAPP